MELVMHRIRPTSDDLQAAFSRLRQRHGWQTTLAAALLDPVRAALVRGEAVRQIVCKRMTPPPRPAIYDRKRAAAGDRDDD
jgi:hypothetical protein